MPKTDWCSYFSYIKNDMGAKVSMSEISPKLNNRGGKVPLAEFSLILN